jgi:hypothetical protein
MTSSTATIKGCPLYVIDANGCKHLTPFIEGSVDEKRFFGVMICSGGPFDCHKKQFFESKDAWAQFNAHEREKCFEKGGFYHGPAWKTGWE